MVLMVYNLSSESLDYPLEIEEFISNDLGGFYKREPVKVQRTLDYDENDLREYLGTYFPGSFSESYAIFINLFRNESIRNSFDIKRDIYILDIGSGTGGNLLGLLWFMKKFLIGFDNKTIHIVSIDGNECALNIQRKIIARFFSSNTDFFYKIIELSRNGFKEELKSIINDFKINHKFDIIMSFKFINEFYRENFLFSWNKIPGNDNEKVVNYLKETMGINWADRAHFENDGRVISLSIDRNSLSIERKMDETAILFIDGEKTNDFIARKEINNNINIYLEKYEENKGMYKTITEVVSDYLEEEGIFILSDVTDKINDNTNLFLSKIMNKEIVEYLNGEDPKLQVIIPLSCAFWHKNCIPKDCFTINKVVLGIRNDSRGFGYCYKIFSNKEFACRVLECKKDYKQDSYNIGENRSCIKGDYGYRDKNARNYRNAFSLENIE